MSRCTDLHAAGESPFAKRSGDKEQEYFSDGLSEELIQTRNRRAGAGGGM